LRRLHSGEIGDYIAWWTAGTAVLGAACLLALTWSGARTEPSRPAACRRAARACWSFVSTSVPSISRMAS